MLLIYYFAIITIACRHCNGLLNDEQEQIIKQDAMTLITKTPDAGLNDFDMENAITKIEYLANDLTKETVAPTEDTKNIYHVMTKMIDDIAEEIKRSNNVQNFIDARGFHRLFSNHLYNTDTRLRTKLLQLLKDIFDVAPGTTKTAIPINIIDRLTDIFANDNNLGLKAHALDVLSRLLPNNPDAQLRVMKISRLEAFYDQIFKLDIGVVQTLLELFNQVLKEHLDARANSTTEEEPERLTYLRSGLVQRMSAPNVCNGLFNIFQLLWSNKVHESGGIKTFYELLKNVEQFCSAQFLKSPKAAKLFEALLEYVSKEDRKEYLEKHGVNVNEFIIIIKQYLGKKEQEIKDEL